MRTMMCREGTVDGLKLHKMALTNTETPRSRNYNDVNNQQDTTTFSFINLFNSALHVSGDKFAHPQEHFLTVYTAFGTMHRHCCWPVLNHGTGRQQCRCIVPKAVFTVKKCSWGWANLSPETCRAELKRLINENVVASCYRCTKMMHGHTNIKEELMCERRNTV